MLRHKIISLVAAIVFCAIAFLTLPPPQVNVYTVFYGVAIIYLVFEIVRKTLKS